MGTRERRDRERADVKARIMDAARQLFAAEGYAAVSMRRIADAIEYTPTAIYFHFKDKESLIRELCTDDFRHLAFAAEAVSSVADPVDRLRQLGHLYVRFAVEHPNHYRLMFMTQPPPAASMPAGSADVEGTSYRMLVQAVTDAIAAGRLRLTDPQLAAQTIWAAVHGVASLEIAMGADPCIPWTPLAARTTAAVDGILDGLLAPPFSDGPEGRVVAGQ